MAADKPNDIDHDAPTNDMEPQAPDDLRPTAPPSSMPKKIGHYTIKSFIGSGGMAQVYLAVQEHPRRKVALKLMRTGITSRSALRRFEFESQILGRLHHPNIAQVYEAGTHDDGSGGDIPGVPYFAMEYIPNAKPITEYARDKKLSTKDRLGLLAKVCDAVHHGHQKGIIHRDLKPGNILVDSSGEPKVIDFGVARSTDSDMAVTTLQTDVGQLIGTLQYMSPEQCEADPDDLDTRSDVYALGVVLYELLCAQLPYDVTKVAVYEAARIVREEPPAKPSTLDRTLRGDVETIALKALEKERERRYRSAEALGDDIHKYLSNEPIEARPPSLACQIRLFAQRNRVAFAAMSAIFAILAIATVVSVIFAVQASRAKDGMEVALDEARGARAVAEDAEREARDNLALAERREQEAEDAKIRAEEEADNAREINNFLTVDLLASVAPSAESGKGKDVLMRDVLDAASEKIEEASQPEGRFTDKPLIEASVRATLGWTYHLLGEYAAAEPHLERARLLRRRELGEEHPSTLRSMNNLVLLYDGQGRYDEAEPLCTKTLEISTRVLGDEHRDTLSVMNNLAILYKNQGRHDEAEPLYAKTLEISKRVLGEEHQGTLSAMNNLAILYESQGRYDEAEPLLITTLETKRRVLGEEHPDTLASMNNLAILYKNQGRYDEAEPLHVATLAIRRRVLGEEHPRTLASRGSLAVLCVSQGRYDQAERLYLGTLEIQKRILGEEHPDTLRCANNIAALYRNQGRYDEAEQLYVETLAIKTRILGEEHPSTLMSVGNLAILYKDQGRYDEAEPLYVKTLAIRRRVLGEEHPETLTFMNSLANLYKNQGRYDQAEPLYLETLEIQKRILGEEHPDRLFSMANLAGLYQEQDRLDEAAALFERAVASARRALGERHWVTGAFVGSYGEVLTKLQRYDEAETALLEAHASLTASLGSQHRRTIGQIVLLINLYTAWHEAEPDKGHDAKADQWRAKLPTDEPDEAEPAGQGG
ncbi:MAG: serine/threonine protein kinase [Phycisphaerales bacterium]|nr:serine/threonine protein kinase [Phycisphaerales bacterium]